MIDKIKQITACCDSDGNEKIYGLSDNGILYFLLEKDMSQPENKWYKLVESPEKGETK